MFCSPTRCLAGALTATGKSHAKLRSGLFRRIGHLGHSRLADRIKATTSTPCTSIWASPAKTARRSWKRPGRSGPARRGSSTPTRNCAAISPFPSCSGRRSTKGVYLLGTSIARPLISKVCLQVAREVGADAYVHGATGKGNDQCRFQLAAEALQPAVRVIAPWRMEEFRRRFPGRSEMIAYCREKNIPVKASAAKPYSSDENCLHISYEAGKLEDLAVNGVELVDFGMTRSPQEAPDEIENVTIGFESGVPVQRQRRAAGGLRDRQPAQRDRRPQRHRTHRHGREPLRGDEEPRGLRGARHDASSTRPIGWSSS